MLAYLWATTRLVVRTVGTVLYAGVAVVAAPLIGVSVVVKTPFIALGVWKCCSTLVRSGRLLWRRHFRENWEWPSETVRRERHERRLARQGIELIAASDPEGFDTEPEASHAPAGRGTELIGGR